MDEKEKMNWKKEVAIRRMALFIIIICFGYLFLSSFLLTVAQGKDYSNSIVGIILLLIGFYWGSSSGSTARGETIDRELNRILPPTSITATTRTVETVDKRKTETISEPLPDPLKAIKELMKKKGYDESKLSKPLSEYTLDEIEKFKTELLGMPDKEEVKP